MTRLLLVRHGQSTWNAVGRWQGRADPPLSELGRRQARQAATTIGAAGVEVDNCHSSSLLRAAETASVLAAELGLGEPSLHPSLRERDIGEWTGLTGAEIEARWPGALGPPRRDPPPGGESHEQLRARVEAGLDALADVVSGRTAVVVVHGGVIRSVERIVGVEPGPIPNLVGWWVTHDGRSWAAGERRPLCAETTTPLSP